MKEKEGETPADLLLPLHCSTTGGKRGRGKEPTFKEKGKKGKIRGQPSFHFLVGRK